MKTFTLFSIALMAAFSLNAQEKKKSEIHVIIEKDGKAIKDTVYMVEDGRSVEHASKILDMTFGEPKEGGKHKVMTFVSEDGKSYVFESGDKDAMEIHKMHSGNAKMGEEHEMIMKMIHDTDNDTQVFVTTEEGEDGETKVIVKKIKISKDGKESTLNEEENVFIIKAGEEGELKHFHHNGEEPLWIEKDGSKVLIIDSKDGVKKKIMVVSDSEGDHEFTNEDGETEKEVKVEVIVEDKKAPAVSEKKKDKKSKK